MPVITDAPIVQKVYDFYRQLYLAVEKMPKRDKYTLGEKAQNSALVMLELLITASYSSRERKAAGVQQAAAKIDVLKILVRLAHEIKAISPKVYLDLQKDLDEIGKMAGGWLRSLK